MSSLSSPESDFLCPPTLSYPEKEGDGDEATSLAAGLYVVATPIGNLSDITLRALDVLKRVDRIAAEDTRQTAILLRHYGIDKPVFSLHGHNEESRLDSLTDAIVSGQAVALVSDAGTPAIADPGALTVAHVRSKGLPVFPIPGPSAVVAALSVAGLSSPRFFFHGFLPHQKGARRDCLVGWRTIDYPVVCYESPHRIVETIEDIGEILGDDREVVVAKELTKVFEQIEKGVAKELLGWLTGKRRLGEFVLIVLPPKALPVGEDKAILVLSSLLNNGVSLKQAVRVAVELTGERRNRLYDLALRIDPARQENEGDAD